MADDFTRIKVRFTKEKETTNTIRFTENGTDRDNRGAIGTLYIQKSVFKGKGVPEKLSVTLKF